MGAGEESTPAKPSKATSTQETQATPSYPDWSSMQAYYGAGATPPFFPSTVASPTPHPYMWGGQHPLMPPYGAPVPYPALYPPAGVYAHPNMSMTPNTLQTNPESDSKAPDGKDQSTGKKLKRCSGGKAGESGKAASGSGNDGGATRSAESGSEGSSDENDENDNHEFSADKNRSFDLMLANGANPQNNPATGNPVAMPTTNLNIGMDLWNAPSAGSGMIKMRSNQSGVSPAPGMGREWIQDERELKRQKRKQSNRESARRSRLRKQVTQVGGTWMPIFSSLSTVASLFRTAKCQL
ncbi:G-box-binding factor 1-like isoform X6 [Solanum dulcamara]|uniref:G-box-binding factor 1-like isoform X6 n=1 Tax=Solanum dulcamara TaxID=45834 RepID=UPI00248699A1|nr:G-box-binding factor 1-like isoform X6 [Solanum dulcamara]